MVPLVFLPASGPNLVRALYWSTDSAVLKYLLLHVSILVFHVIAIFKAKSTLPKTRMARRKISMPRPTTYLTTFTVVQPTSRKQLGHIISSHKIQTENNFKIKTLNLLCCILAGCSWTAVFAQLIDFFSHLLSLHQKLNSRQGASYSSCILNIHQFHI